jgi:hypothetical protein
LRTTGNGKRFKAVPRCDYGDSAALSPKFS